MTLVPYLIKTIKSNKFSDLINVFDEVPLDMNLLLWQSEESGEIKIDQKKDRVEIMSDVVEPWHDPELANKLLRVIQHYAAGQTSINRGRLDGQIKDPVTHEGYKRYQYLMTLQYLIDQGQVIEEVISVPGVKDKRPARKMVFLNLPENAEFNAEWNAKQVNNWLAEWEANKVK
jgi:hypothetical protein